MTATWTAPPVERTDPPWVGGEREALDAYLDYHRATLLSKCAGLTAAQLKRRDIPPSALSLLGLVRHMVEVEQWWFDMHVGGADAAFAYSTDEHPNADFDDLESADAEADLAAFRRAVERAREVARGRELDEVVPSRGHRREVQMTVRSIYLHMIEEYARHNGHADLLRERVDGVTGE